MIRYAIHPPLTTRRGRVFHVQLSGGGSGAPGFATTPGRRRSAGAGQPGTDRFAELVETHTSPWALTARRRTDQGLGRVSVAARASSCSACCLISGARRDGAHSFNNAAAGSSLPNRLRTLAAPSKPSAARGVVGQVHDHAQIGPLARIKSSRVRAFFDNASPFQQQKIRDRCVGSLADGFVRASRTV